MNYSIKVKKDIFNNPLLLIDTAGSLMHDWIDIDSENESKYNNV